MLENDIQAHRDLVETLVETERGSAEASTTHEKLNELNNQWRDLLQKAADRRHELEENAIVEQIQHDGMSNRSGSSTPDSLFDDENEAFNGWQPHDWGPIHDDRPSILDRRQYILSDSPIQPSGSPKQFKSKMMIQNQDPK